MSKIETARDLLLKNYNIVFSTENMLDREPKVMFLCEFIDHAIKGIEEAQSDLSAGLDRDDIDEIEDAMTSAEFSLHGIVDTLDELRTDIEALRTWGQSWKELAKQLIEENDINLANYSELLYNVENGDVA